MHFLASECSFIWPVPRWLTNYFVWSFIELHTYLILFGTVRLMLKTLLFSCLFFNVTGRAEYFVMCEEIWSFIHPSHAKPFLPAVRFQSVQPPCVLPLCTEPRLTSCSVMTFHLLRAHFQVTFCVLLWLASTLFGWDYKASVLLVTSWCVSSWWHPGWDISLAVINILRK